MAIIIELGVKDVQKSIDFYTQALGGELVNAVKDDADQPIWAEATVCGTSIMFERTDVLVDELPFVKPCGAGASCAFVLRVSRQQAETLLEQVKKARGVIDIAPHETDYGTFEYALRDPDGYVIVVAGRA